MIRTVPVPRVIDSPSDSQSFALKFTNSANPAERRRRSPQTRLRGACNDLALRVTHAVIALYKGTAMLHHHPANGWRRSFVPARLVLPEPRDRLHAGFVNRPIRRITFPPMQDQRITKLAQVLVNYSVGVKPGQLVRIAGSAVAAPLITEIFREVIKAGGNPFIRMNPDEAFEIFIAEASEEQLKFQNPLNQFEIEKIDCSIGIWGEDNTRAMTNADASRMGMVAAARKPISNLFMKRASDKSLRWTGTQFPCQASAQDAEMSLRGIRTFCFQCLPAGSTRPYHQLETSE